MASATSSEIGSRISSPAAAIATCHQRPQQQRASDPGERPGADLVGRRPTDDAAEDEEVDERRDDACCRACPPPCLARSRRRRSTGGKDREEPATDEPTGRLDSVTAEKIFEIFEKLVKKGKTILMVSHDMNFANRSSRTLEIADGRILN